MKAIIEPMLRFPRKKKIEGWSVSDVRESRLTRLIESIRSSNKAWVLCFIGIIVIASFMYVATGPRDSLAPITIPAPPHNESGPYQDEAHEEFLQDYHVDMQNRGMELELRFTDAGLLDLVMSESTNNDDIRFAAKMAAVGVYNRFNNAPIISIYTYDNSVPPKLKLVGSCQWDRHGFTVKFLGAGDDEPAGSPQ